MANQKVNNNTTIAASLKKQAIILNEEMLKASNELIDGAVVTSEKWQTLTEKAVKAGLKMFAKQQDLALTTLEIAKGQFDASAKKFNKLVGKTAKKVKAKASEVTDNEPTINNVIEATVPAVKKAVAQTKAIVAEATPAVKKAVVKTKEAIAETTPAVKKAVAKTKEAVAETVPAVKKAVAKTKEVAVETVETVKEELATA